MLEKVLEECDGTDAVTVEWSEFEGLHSCVFIVWTRFCVQDRNVLERNKHMQKIKKH